MTETVDLTIMRTGQNCHAVLAASSNPLPPSPTPTLGLFSSRMMMTAVMSSTPAGGFFSDLASPRSFLFRVSRAASACRSREGEGEVTKSTNRHW
jgi:hypothetical protein